MDITKKGSRIKYYRKLLGITQKELVGNCFSIPLIRFIEANKRGVTVTQSQKAFYTVSDGCAIYLDPIVAPRI